jgi:hypothetical protein
MHSVGERLALFASLALLVVSCTTGEPAARPSGTARVAGPTASANPASGITREPADLVVLPGERRVVAAFAQAGMPVQLIGSSKFENLLGARRPARVFTAATAWGAGGADVLFVEEAIGSVRVCAVPGSVGRTVYTMFVGDQSVGTVDAGQVVIYSIGPGYFVQAYDTATSDALRQGLGLSAPSC